MRLAILISLCVLIFTFSIGSIVFYRSWKRNRYDTLIIEAATESGLHPALLKAIMDTRGHFTYYTRGSKGEVGLLQVPEDGVRDYKTLVKKDEEFEFGWVCINKAHPPHEPDMKDNLPRTCNICRSPLVPGEYYPKDNIMMGAWYLAQLKKKVEDATQGKVDDVIPLVTAAYCRTEATVREKTDNYRNPDLPPDLRNSISDVLDKFRRYKQKGLK